MHIMFFTERAYHALPEDEIFKRRSFFGVPNTFLDRDKGAQLLNQYIDEKIYCDELGLRWRDAERTSRDALLHGRGDERRGVRARQGHQAGQDRFAR